jgi:dienelactone hydrolase
MLSSLSHGLNKLFGQQFLGLILIFGAAFHFSPASASGQEKTRPEDQRAAITRHLNMNYPPPYCRTPEEWSAVRESLRQQILVAAGILPAPSKCPLNANIFGRLNREGYSIEKVYFESLPGFLVTGNLYRPLGKKGPFPAVLLPHGHFSYGRLENTATAAFQPLAVTFARMGYIAFSYDMVGYNDSRQVGHKFQGERESLWGFSVLGLQLWNSIRCVDFLEQLPDVDRSRIACTGASGGGTQTFLLTAVDDRIVLSAPVNMISSIMQGGDNCENAPNLRIDTNNVEIGAMMAPRPMIMVSATGDWTKNTLEVEYPAIQKIYRLLGAEDKITAARVKAEHNYNKETREHVYRWFSKWLSGTMEKEGQFEKNVTIESASDLLVFYGREMPAGMKTEQEIARDFMESAAKDIARVKPENPQEWKKFEAEYLPALRFSLMAESPAAADLQAFNIEPGQQPAFRVVRFSLTRRGKGDSVPITLWLPGGKLQPRQSVLLAHPNGSAEFETEGNPGKLVDTLLKQGCSVMVPDLFNTGKASFRRAESLGYFTTYNRTDDANRVQDILTSLSYLKAQTNDLPTKVVGFGNAGLWCMLARGLAEGQASFSADLSRFDAASDESFLKGLYIPNLRRAGDFKTAALLNLQSPLWAYNAAPGFPSQQILDSFKAMGKAALIRIDSVGAGDGQILNWILEGLQRIK